MKRLYGIRSRPRSNPARRGKRRPVAAVMTMLTLAAASPALEAQTSDQSAPADRGAAPIEVTARRYGDSVVLRWTPADPAVWATGLRSGYRIEREGGGAVTVLPWSEAEWRRRANDAAIIKSVLRVLYDTARTDVADVGDGSLQFEMTLEEARYGAALLMAASDPVVAEGLALRWVDRSAAAGPRAYCVSVNGGADRGRGCVTVAHGDARPLAAPFAATVGSEGGQVLLTWSMARDPDLLGFTIDRIDERTGIRTLLTPAPVLAIELPDSEPHHRGYLEDRDVRDGGIYRYEVRAINGFGELSAPASARLVLKKEQPLPAAPVPAARQLGHCALEITLTMAAPAADGICVRVERSRTLFEGYEPVATRCADGAISIVDSTASRKYPYYRTVVVDPSGRERESEGVYVQFVDDTPPAAPTDLQGNVDDYGVVRLSWNPSTECDVRGYHVFWANDPEHEFVPRTRAIVEEPAFTDTITIETLTRRVFYRVVAVDHTGLPSEFSPVLELLRPDHLRPLAPVILEARPEGRGILVRWKQSQSSDIERQRLTRGTGSEWTELALLPAHVGEYLDTSVRLGIKYSYRLLAEDSSGNRSSIAGPVSARIPQRREPVAITRLRGTYQKERRAVELRWDVEGMVLPEDWFVVLRSRPGGQLVPLTTARAEHRAIVDEDLTLPGEYTYVLQIASGQWRSELSERAVVAVP